MTAPGLGSHSLWNIANDHLDEYQADRTPAKRTAWLLAFAEYQAARRAATRRHLDATYSPTRYHYATPEDYQ